MMKNLAISFGNLRWVWLSIIVIILDQITKYWVSHSLTLWESVPLIPFFNITLKHNVGAAFGFLNEVDGWQRWMFIAIAIFVSAFILFWLARTPKQNNLSSAAFALILGGAVGNLWDRLTLGYVIDFIDFYINTWHYATINLADSAISLGAILLIVATFASSKRETLGSLL